MEGVAGAPWAGKLATVKVGAGLEWRTSVGLTGYADAVTAMERRAIAIRDGGAPGLVWFVEHPAMFTGGTSAAAAELVDPMGLPVHRTGRGGRWTYHGPGQRVAYVVLDLVPYGRDLRAHVWRLEEAVILAAADLGVRAERRADRVGVWVVRPGRPEAKLAAIGVRVRRWVAFHGLALNIDPDLAHYRGIVPCGLAGFDVTSLAALAAPTDRARVDALLAARLAQVLALPPSAPTRLENAGTSRY